MRKYISLKETEDTASLHGGRAPEEASWRSRDAIKSILRKESTNTGI